LKQSLKLALIFILAAALLTTVALILKYHCPASGFALSRERRELHRLKNRTALPQLADFDTAVTVEKMLHAGDDHDRWSATRAARVEGYVVSIANGPLELSNCYLPCSRDIHIHIGSRPNAPPREQVVLEITPTMQEWARSQGRDWSEETVRGKLLNHWCSFEGWLLYDSHHAGESENSARGRAANWRATAWEIHPITNFEIKQFKYGLFTAGRGLTVPRDAEEAGYRAARNR
jgi:hypothetical protein